MENMIFTGVSILAFAANGICTRIFQLHIQKNKHDILLYQTLFCFIAGICFFTVTPLSDIVHIIPTCLYGITFGIFFSLAVLYSARCYESGPMSLTSIVTNMSMIIPLLYSCFVYKESITLSQTAGVILMIVTLVLSGINQSSKSNRASMKWLVFVIIAFIANGVTAVIQKQYGITYPDGQRNMFMSIAYFTSAAIFVINYLSKRIVNKNTAQKISGWLPLVGLSLISGIGSFGGNGILAYLSTRMSASILYPCLNGGLCIIIAAASFVFFKEKINKYKVFAAIAGLSGIIILNL